MSSKIYNCGNHNKHLLQVHLIFVCKYRKKLLVGELEEDMKQVLFEIASDSNLIIKTQETDKDHIHILLSYPPIISITEIVKKLKQQSTYKIWQKHYYFLKKQFWSKNIFWSKSYFSCSIGMVSEETIKKYIANQG